MRLGALLLLLVAARAYANPPKGGQAAEPLSCVERMEIIQDVCQRKQTKACDKSKDKKKCLKEVGPFCKKQRAELLAKCQKKSK